MVEPTQPRVGGRSPLICTLAHVPAGRWIWGRGGRPPLVLFGRPQPGHRGLEALRSAREEPAHETLADQADELNHLLGWAWEQVAPGVVLPEMSPEPSLGTRGDSWARLSAQPSPKTHRPVGAGPSASVLGGPLPTCLLSRGLGGGPRETTNATSPGSCPQLSRPVPAPTSSATVHPSNKNGRRCSFDPLAASPRAVNVPPRPDHPFTCSQEAQRGENVPKANTLCQGKLCSKNRRGNS